VDGVAKHHRVKMKWSAVTVSYGLGIYREEWLQNLKILLKVHSSVIRHSLNSNPHFTATDNVNRKLKILSLSRGNKTDSENLFVACERVMVKLVNIIIKSTAWMKVRKLSEKRNHQVHLKFHCH
jgi:hypothetical protein